MSEGIDARTREVLRYLDRCSTDEDRFEYLRSVLRVVRHEGQLQGGLDVAALMRRPTPHTTGGKDE